MMKSGFRGLARNHDSKNAIPLEGRNSGDDVEKWLNNTIPSLFFSAFQISSGIKIHPLSVTGPSGPIDGYTKLI